MRVKARSLGVVLTFLVISSLAGCGENQDSICQSARNFQLAVNEIQIDDLASALGPEFWQELDALLGELATSDSDEVSTLAAGLRVELGRFIKRLEAADYNVIAAALDPEAAKQFFMVTAALVAFGAEELQSQVDLNC